jgi:hypothetical protein
MWHGIGLLLIPMVEPVLPEGAKVTGIPLSRYWVLDRKLPTKTGHGNG